MLNLVGGGLLAILGLAGLLLIAAAGRRAKLTLGQTATLWLLALGFEAWVVTWLATEVRTLLFTADPHDHDTAVLSVIAADPLGQAGLVLVGLGLLHLFLHLAWRRYPLWPSSDPKTWSAPEPCGAELVALGASHAECDKARGHQGRHCSPRGVVWGHGRGPRRPPGARR